MLTASRPWISGPASPGVSAAISFRVGTGLQHRSAGNAEDTHEPSPFREARPQPEPGSVTSEPGAGFACETASINGTTIHVVRGGARSSLGPTARLSAGLVRAAASHATAGAAIHSGRGRPARCGRFGTKRRRLRHRRPGRGRAHGPHVDDLNR